MSLRCINGFPVAAPPRCYATSQVFVQANPAAGRADFGAAAVAGRSLERIDHTHGLEGLQSRHILRVENVHASSDARNRTDFEEAGIEIVDPFTA
jgi:hypothetical protein